MKIQTPAYLKELLAPQEPPCITIYMPTQRAKPPATENPIRLGALIQKAENEVNRRYPGHNAKAALAQFTQLQHDDSVWRHPTDALAIFVSPTIFQAVKLERPVREMVEVGHGFHLKPLLRAQQFNGRYQVLCLCQRDVRVLEGDRDNLWEIDQRNVPRTIFDALGLRPTPATGDEGRINNISGSMDLERFFRIIDRSVLENHSRLSALPILLCAVPNYHEQFHRISRNPYLMEEGIKLDPNGVDLRRLHNEAWKIIEPAYQRAIHKVIDDFGLAKARHRGSDDLQQVARAAADARIGTLLLDSDKHIGGRLDPASGRLELGDPKNPAYEDILDDIAEKVIQTGGQILVIPPNQMPTPTGIAAIYRF